MTNGSNIARAIEELVTERDHLAARLAKVDEAIATMRELFHLPNVDRRKAPRAVAKERREQPTANGTPRFTDRTGAATAERIVAALKAGPLTPGEITEKIGVSVWNQRRAIERLIDEGVVMRTGHTHSRRYALKPASAKEAP